MLKRYFSLRGVTFNEGTSIDYDKRTGRLIVRNTLENLQRLDELIRQLDAIEKPLIMIEIKAIEVTEQDMQELGFDVEELREQEVDAGLGSDLPLLLGITVITAAIVFGGNLIADLLYGAVDPKIRRGAAKS